MLGIFVSKVINMTNNQLNILKELVELLNGKFDTFPAIEINPCQCNLEKICRILTRNWNLLNF